MAVTADQVVVQLQAQTAQYEAGMRKAAGEAERFEKQALAVVVAQTREARALYEAAKATTAKGSAEIKSAAAALQAAKSTEAATRAEIAHAAALRQMAVAADTANGRLNSIQGSAGGIAAQFNDIGVTAAAGMNPLLIALQQGTQLTQGFAGQSSRQVLSGLGAAFASVVSPVSLLTIGLVAGAAALIQWGTNALTAETNTEGVDKALKRLLESLDAYQQYATTATTSTADLSEKFGIFAAEVKGFSEYMAQVALGQSFDELKTVVETLNGPLEQVRQGFANVAMAKDQLARIPVEDANGLMLAQEAMGIYQDSLDAAAAKLGLSAEQALRLSTAIGDVGKANGVADIAAAASNALAVMQELVPAGQELPAPLREAAVALEAMASKAAEANAVVSQMPEWLGLLAGSASDAADAIAAIAAMAPQGGWLSGAIADAATLAGTLWEAARAKAAMDLGGDDERGSQRGQARSAGEFRRDTAISNRGRVGRAGGGGGGANPDAAEAKRVIAETRTEAEKLVIEMEKLQRLKDAGLIDAETFERAKNAMQELSPIAKNVSNALKTAFDGIFDDADAALESLGKKLLMLALKMQLAQLMPNVFGANGIVPLVGAGYASGGYTGPGGVNQAAGVVHKGEVVFSQSDVARNGGVAAVEAMRLGLRGYAGGGAVNVPTMGIAGSYGGGSSVTVIDQRGAGAPAIETQTTRGPNGRDMVTMWVKEDMARGKFNGPMNGVYGQKPQKVTR